MTKTIVKCANCGTRFLEAKGRCPHCAEYLEGAKPKPAPKKKVVIEEPPDFPPGAENVDNPKAAIITEDFPAPRPWKISPMAAIIVCVAFLIVFVQSPFMSPGPSAPVKQGSAQGSVLRAELAYLNDIDEVAWVEIDGNNVYIGWDDPPGDLGAINRAAAMAGNRAIDFGVHVWSVKGGAPGWRPGGGPYLCETTARHGRLEDSSC